jgi:hypothetical protein
VLTNRSDCISVEDGASPCMTSVNGIDSLDLRVNLSTDADQTRNNRAEKQVLEALQLGLAKDFDSARFSLPIQPASPERDMENTMRGRCIVCDCAEPVDRSSSGHLHSMRAFVLRNSWLYDFIVLKCSPNKTPYQWYSLSQTKYQF